MKVLPEYIVARNPPVGVSCGDTSEQDAILSRSLIGSLSTRGRLMATTAIQSVFHHA